MESNCLKAYNKRKSGIYIAVYTTFLLDFFIRNLFIYLEYRLVTPIGFKPITF